MSHEVASSQRSSVVSWRAARWAVLPLVLAVAGVAGSKLFTHEDTTPSFRPYTGKGKRDKTGAAFVAETQVHATSVASMAAPGFDSERVWSGQDDWEPAVAADPSSNSVYQMVTRYTGPKPCTGCPFPGVAIRRSTDSGATWGAEKWMPNPNKNHMYDPQVEVATDGTVYVGWLEGRTYKPGIMFAKTTNGGTTWTNRYNFTPMQGTPNWSDKPVLAISADGRDAYMAFNASDSYVASSHDFGATWSANVKTNSDTRYWFHTAGAVAPNGNVYFATTDFTQDYTGDAIISVIRSTNGGATWTTLPIDVSREMPACAWAAGCYFGFFGAFAGLAVDENGTVMIAYTANNSPGAPMSIYVRTSTDGGNTWSPRQQVSGQPLTVNHHNPTVAAGTTPGDFRVVWQDDRNGSPNKWNVWYRRTTNGGGSWGSTLQMSDLTSGAPYKSALGHAFPYGDYLEIAVDASGSNHIIWGSGASFTGPGGVWYTRGQ
ncbi:MAG: glycoside hydrolase [Myxococcaceae bacterium]|nr:glycoside hydrolase [Myxococcaceae bacterium]